MEAQLYEALRTSSIRNRNRISQALDETGHSRYCENEGSVVFMSGDLPYGKIYYPPEITVTVDD